MKITSRYSWILATLGAAVIGAVAVSCGDSGGASATPGTPSGGPGTNEPPKVSDAGGGASVDAQGSTFILPFLSKAFDEYKTKNGFQINYTGGGSSAGIKGVSDGTTPFGASDAPMNDQELSDSKVGKILNIPLILGTVAVAYNLPGVKERLQLDGQTLADIFMGKISKWNDPKIAATNPGVKLPDMGISVQVRADGSGTTYVFSDYLSHVSEGWKSSMGTNKKLKWNERAQQWKGSEGVANNTKQTPGSITYVELSWVKKSDLSYAAIKNPAGKFVTPDAAAATAAAASVKLPADFRGSIVNAPGEASYPITSYTFGLIPEDLSANAHGGDIKKTISYVLTDAQQFAEGLDYAKLPDTVAADAQKALDTVKAN